MSPRNNRKRVAPVVPNSLDEMFRMGAVMSDDAASDISRNTAPQSLDELLRMGEVKPDDIASDSTSSSASMSLDELFQKGTAPASLDELMASGTPLTPSPIPATETLSDNSPQAKTSDDLPSVTVSDLAPPPPAPDQPQLPPQPVSQPQPQPAAFPTVQTPDGLVLGTNNLRFFSMPNYTLEQAKMIADNIKKSNAQVLAFQEVEGNAAMDNLMMPNFPGWKYKMNDTPDHQDVAFMWNPEAVTMNGEPLVYFANEELPDTPGEKLFPRAPLVAEFVDKKTGTPFKMVNLHLKSQYTPPGLSKEEAALWQEKNTAHRMRQLQYVADLVDRLRESGMPVFVPGDYNFNLSGTGKVNKQLRDMINFGIRKLENQRGTPESEKKYSYDGGRQYRSNLDVIGYANVPGTDLSPAYEVETSFPGGGGPDHDIVASVWKAVNRKGLSPTDFVANPVIDPDASAAKTQGHDPAFVNNPYVLDAINGVESALQRFDKIRGHARSDVLNRSVTPWHDRFSFGASERSKRPPSLSQLAFAPVSWARDVFLPSGLVEKPKTSEEVKKGEGNAFTDFEFSDLIPFISSATSSPAKAIMKSFKNLDFLRSGLANSLKETGLGNYLAFKKWNGYEKNEVPDPKIDWQPAAPQPMNIEDAQNIEHWFAGPSDQEPYLKREETDKRSPEEKWKDFLASDPENSGFDSNPEYEADGKSPYLKTADAPEGDKNFTPLLHVLNDVAYSTAAGFNSWLSSLANGAGVMVHAASDPIARATGLWNPEGTNFLQDAGRGLDSLKNAAEREVKNKDALYSTASRHVGSIAPTLMMMAAGGAPAAPGLINPTAVTPLAAKMFATGAGSMAQTVSGAGEVYKSARELGGTHEQAMDAAGKAAIAGSALNLAANYLAGPHGLFTAGRLSNNELLKKIFGAERWIERPLVSPYRLFKYATGMRWPRTYINALKTSRSSLDAGLRAYLQAYGNGEITRAAVQSTLPYREVGGDANATFLDKLLSKESLPTGKKLESLIPAFYSGALINLVTSAPQIAKNFREGFSEDRSFYSRKRSEKNRSIRDLQKRISTLEAVPQAQRTGKDNDLIRAFKRELSDAQSRSSLGETFFPYRSALKKAHDDFIFGDRSLTPEQVDQLRSRLDDVNSKLVIRLPTQKELNDSLSPKIPGHFTRDKNHHFVRESTASRLGELLDERDFLESTLYDYDHPISSALRSLNPVSFFKNVARSQIDKFRDYWDLQPKILEGTKELRQLENSALADLKSSNSHDLTDDSVTRILHTYKNMPRSSRENVKTRYFDDLANSSIARISRQMRNEEAQRYANLDKLYRALRLRHTLADGEKPTFDRDYLLKALDREIAREQQPQLKNWAEVNAIANTIADLSPENRADEYDYHLNNMSYADVPKLGKEIDVAQKAFDRAMREIALRDSGVKWRPGLLARPREVLQNTARYQDPLISLSKALSARHDFLTTNKALNAINKATEPTPIQRLIFDLPLGEPLPDQVIPDFVPASSRTTPIPKPTSPHVQIIPDFTPAPVPSRQRVASSLHHVLNSDLPYATAKRIFSSLKGLRR